MSDSTPDSESRQTETRTRNGSGTTDIDAESDADTDSATAEIDREARLELLRAENERLREEYVRARRASYRRAALGLGVIGLLAVGSGVLFPAVRETLFVLGAIGLFGAILTYYLTPERFVTAETGERIYAALAETTADLTGQLGLQETRVYVPTDGTPRARLFVPQHTDYELPEGDALDRPLVVGTDDAQRGLSTIPTGATLFDEFERSLPGSLADSPTRATDQAAEALVEAFELADSVETDVDVEAGRASVDITGSVYGGVERFDNPLGSLIAVALARALDQPVEVELTDGGDDVLTVTCRWKSDEPSDE